MDVQSLFKSDRASDLHRFRVRVYYRPNKRVVIAVIARTERMAVMKATDEWRSRGHQVVSAIVIK